MPDKRFWKQSVTIYLYHLDQPYKHAAHHLGSAEDFEQRAAEHASGTGARLMAAVVTSGITYRLARKWENVPRYHEATLHHRKENPSLCPICSGDVALKRGEFVPSQKKSRKSATRSR
jgi:hypothetical protein